MFLLLMLLFLYMRKLFCLFSFLLFLLIDVVDMFDEILLKFILFEYSLSLVFLLLKIFNSCGILLQLNSLNIK